MGPVKSPFQPLLERFTDIDEIDTAVLQVHLFIEEAMDGVITAAVIRSEPLSRARLSFSQKLQLVQALSPLDSQYVWQFIRALNSLRNELAHNRKPPKRDRKIEDLLNLYHQASEGVDTALQLRGYPEGHTLVLAALGIAGYLITAQEEIEKARHPTD